MRNFRTQQKYGAQNERPRMKGGMPGAEERAQARFDRAGTLAFNRHMEERGLLLRMGADSHIYGSCTDRLRSEPEN